MEFYLNELLQDSVMLLYHRAVHFGENLKEFGKAEACIDKAYTHGLKLLEGCYPGNFANMIKIRLYYMKLKMNKGDWTAAKELIFDNLKDAEIQMSLLKSSNPSCANNPKAQKCVLLSD